LQQLTEKTIGCPYCGETLAVLIDLTDLDQQYIEDCQVCCKPIVFVIKQSINAEIEVSVYSEDEAF